MACHSCSHSVSLAEGRACNSSGGGDVPASAPTPWPLGVAASSAPPWWGSLWVQGSALCLQGTFAPACVRPSGLLGCLEEALSRQLGTILSMEACASPPGCGWGQARRRDLTLQTELLVLVPTQPLHLLTPRHPQPLSKGHIWGASAGENPHQRSSSDVYRGQQSTFCLQCPASSPVHPGPRLGQALSWALGETGPLLPPCLGSWILDAR